MPRMARADSNDTAGMETPDEVMSRLRQMRSLRFESCSAVASGWDGHGTGQVLVEEPGVMQPTDHGSLHNLGLDGLMETLQPMFYLSEYWDKHIAFFSLSARIACPMRA